MLHKCPVLRCRQARGYLFDLMRSSPLPQVRWEGRIPDSLDLEESLPIDAVLKETRVTAVRLLNLHRTTQLEDGNEVRRTAASRRYVR